MREYKVEMSEGVVVAAEVDLSVVYHSRFLDVTLMTRAVAVHNIVAIPVVEVHVFFDVT
jgi:hypothetical protein